MGPVTTEKTDTPIQQNLRRLFLLRNITVAGVSVGVLIAVTAFSLQLPLPEIALILAALAMLNLMTWWRIRRGTTLGDLEIFIQLLLDVAGLTGVFFFTGGAANPFVWFLLLPLIIVATLLSRRATWLMAGLTVICYTFLLVYQTPLEHPHMGHDGGFQMHVFGMWIGFVISAGFVAGIIVNMAHSLRERDRKLAQAREQVLQNERLIALGTLAAGTAHELGTPLGTMAILTADLEQEYTEAPHTDLHHKLGILRQQIDRCKEALSVISVSAGAGRAESGHRILVRKYLEEVIAEWQTQRPGNTLDYHPAAVAPQAEIIAERTLTQALVNILNNAAEVSPADVQLHADWSDTELRLEVTDRGPGLEENIYDRLGKTPVSTKTDGLGVGLYLAHATIQRLGGKLSIRNREHGGTITTIRLPLLAPCHGMS